MITRTEARQMVLTALYAAELNDDEPAVIRNNVLKRAFWDKYTIKIDVFASPISLSEATKVMDGQRRIELSDLKLQQLVDVSLQETNDRFVAVAIRRRQEEDEPIKAIDNESRFWGRLLEVNNPFEYFDFASKLFDRTQQKKDELDDLIRDHVKNWELDRLALLDRLILRMAVAEWLYMPDIPVKVTINEAIELAKKFSTTKSGRFVNGVLDVALVKLQADGLITKFGRGQL